MSMPGGLADQREATEEIQGIANKVRSTAEQKAGTTFSEFTAVSYRTQVVAGTNYYIKVKVGDNDYVHLKIYQTLPHAGSELSLTSVQTGKSVDDPLEYFE